MNNWSDLLGIRVIEHPLPAVANVQIDPRFEFITPEARTRINADLRRLCGEHEVAYLMDLDSLGLTTFGSRPMLVMNPKAFAMLRSSEGKSE